MTVPGVKKILSHPDKDELVSKMLINIPDAEINQWLASKYTNSSESKFVISVSALKRFRETYLDVYQLIKEDFSKAKTALANGTEENFETTLQKMPEYKDLVLSTVGKELDLKQKIAGLCTVVETRVAQIFDVIEEDPRNVGRTDRVFLEMVNTLGLLLDKAYRIIEEGPDARIEHSYTITHIDSHVNCFYEAIKNTLAKMDLTSSMIFMEHFNEELSKLKDPSLQQITPVENRLAEVKVISETINQKVNQYEQPEA